MEGNELQMRRELAGGYSEHRKGEILQAYDERKIRSIGTHEFYDTHALLL